MAFALPTRSKFPPLSGVKGDCGTLPYIPTSQSATVPGAIEEQERVR